MVRRAFTLVELLVVIGIIGLLLGLLLTALGASRERTRATFCQANLRQLVIGLSNYDVANGMLPYGFETPGLWISKPSRYAGFAGTIDLPGLWWFDRSQKVDHWTMDGYDVLICPSKRQGDARLARDILCGNYAANLSIFRNKGYLPPYGQEFPGPPLSLDRIRRPGETMLLMDAGYSVISWWHAAEASPVEIPSKTLPGIGIGGVQHGAYVPGMSINETKPLWPGQTEDAIGGRHPGKTVNVGFADGHVGSRQAEELLVRKTGDDRWDCGPLWQPSDYSTAADATTQ